jgi:hypothetical protein
MDEVTSGGAGQTIDGVPAHIRRIDRGAPPTWIRRPGPLRWLRYAVGFGISHEHDAWVLSDTTRGTWLLRHITRSLLMVSIPVALVVLFLPAPLSLRILTACAAGGSALMFMLVHTIETTERRLTRAGFVGGTGEIARAHRSANAQRMANAARRKRRALRGQRR